MQYGHGILVYVYRPSVTQEQSLVTHDNLPMVVGVCIYHSFMDKGKARLDECFDYICGHCFACLL